MPFSKEETRTQSNCVTCPRVLSWQWGLGRDTKQGADRIPFSLSLPKNPWKLSHGGERWGTLLNEPRVAFKDPGTYGDFNTDAQYSWWPGKAGSVVTDLLSDRSWHLSSPWEPEKITYTHRGFGGIEQRRRYKQVPFLNFVKTPFGSQGPGYAVFTLSMLKKVKQAGTTVRTNVWDRWATELLEWNSPVMQSIRIWWAPLSCSEPITGGQGEDNCHRKNSSPSKVEPGQSSPQQSLWPLEKSALKAINGVKRLHFKSQYELEMSWINSFL